MPTEVICTIITGAVGIICAAMAEQRAKEGRLQLAMINANCQLTVGVAMALKRGHCNGEVEAGLAAIEKTTKEYEQFLEGIAIDHITR